MNIEIYCDIADLKLIKKYNNNNLVKGFTTNPSLMRSAGAKNYKNYSKKILKITKKLVSLEVFSDDIDEMKKQALKINSWGKNVYVKIPVTTSKNKFTGKIIRELNSKGVKLNITAVYSYNHIKKIYKCINSKTPLLISIFAGRMSDVGKDPLPILKKAVHLVKNKKNIKVLWASTREAYNYLQAKKIKCHIITIPPKIIDQISNFGKSYNQLTLDTVKKFLEDSKASKFKL